MDKRLGNIDYSRQFVRKGVQWLQNARYPPLYVYPSPRKYLRVVSTKEADNVLSTAFDNLGDIGRDRFYAWRRTKYVGLSRTRVLAFLDSQEFHQLALPVRKQKVIHSIVTEMPMQRWQADFNVAWPTEPPTP